MMNNLELIASLVVPTAVAMALACLLLEVARERLNSERARLVFSETVRMRFFGVPETPIRRNACGGPSFLF